jgi:diguanylate cyclase (GGDEF)-like protein
MVPPGAVDLALASSAIALLGALMLLGLLIASSGHDEVAAGWLALTCGLLSVALLFANKAVISLLPGIRQLAWPHFGSLAGAALTWSLAGLAIKHWHMFGHLDRRHRSIVLLLTVLVSGLALLGPAATPLLLTWWIGFGAWALYPAVRAVTSHQRYGLATTLAAAPLLIGLAIDMPMFLESGRGSPFALATMVSFALIHCSIITRQFLRAQRQAARLSAHLADEVEVRTRELQRKNDRLEQAQAALRQANLTLKQLSITDGLTQVANRMHFEQQLEQEWRRCARQGALLSLLMIDADHFKDLNDTAGHLAGDRCLQALATELRRQFRRAGELVGRYGGEEFVVLLPEAGLSRALALGEGLRESIANLAIPGVQARFTVSIGVSTTIPTPEQPSDHLLAAADAALYEAKSRGRNRVESLPLIGGRKQPVQQRLQL